MEIFFKCDNCGEHRVLNVQSEEEAQIFAYPELLTGRPVLCFKCSTQMTHIGKQEFMMGQLREGQGSGCLSSVILFLVAAGQIFLP